MKFILIAALAVVLCACGCSAGLIGAPTYYRTPQFDSAAVRSEQHGGGFSYSTLEGHAYAAVQPVLKHVYHPVAVSYNYITPYRASYFGGGFYNPLYFAPVPASVPVSSPIVQSQFESNVFQISGGNAGGSAPSAPATAPEAEKQETAGATALDDDSVSVESA